MNLLHVTIRKQFTCREQNHFINFLWISALMNTEQNRMCSNYELLTDYSNNCLFDFFSRWVVKMIVKPHGVVFRGEEEGTRILNVFTARGRAHPLPSSFIKWIMCWQECRLWILNVNVNLIYVVCQQIFVHRRKCTIWGWVEMSRTLWR